MTRTEAQAYRKSIEDAAALQSDEQALENIELFPKWEGKIGQWVETGERLQYNGKLYKVLQPHTVQADWTPDTAVSLFVEVSAEVWPPIPENIPSTAPWMNGQKGTWRGQHYICQLDYCVWNPDQLPSAWSLVE